MLIERALMMACMIAREEMAGPVLTQSRFLHIADEYLIRVLTIFTTDASAPGVWSRLTI